MFAISNGSTSIILRFVVLKDDGTKYTGLDHTTSGLIISTIASNESTATAYSVAASKLETISTLGTYAAPSATKARFKAVDATNHPGMYELHLADARWSVANSKGLYISVSGATEIGPVDMYIQHQALPANVETLTSSAVDSIDLGLTSGQLTALGLLLDQVDTGTVATDAGNNASSFKTNMTSANGYESKVGQVLFFGSAAHADNVRVPARIETHNLTTGFVTVDRSLPAVPENGNPFSITGYIISE